jgi:hypothetical protein
MWFVSLIDIHQITTLNALDSLIFKELSYIYFSENLTSWKYPHKYIGSTLLLNIEKVSQWEENFVIQQSV